MGLKGSGTVLPYGTHTVLTLQDLPKVTQLISGRAGPELFCPASLEKDLPALSRVGPAGSPLREAALVPPPPPPMALARGNLMTQAWGLEAGILVPAWLWGPGLPQPAPNVGHQKAAAQPPPPTALLPKPRGWEKQGQRT